MIKNIFLKLLLLLHISVFFSANVAAQSNPEDWWVSLGDPNGGNSYLDMLFQNEVTGEIVHAFCIQIDKPGPGQGHRFYLHSNGIWLIPENSTRQIMCIFKSECNYTKPVIGGKPENCPPWGTSFTLTASCAQGQAKWYLKGALDLELVGTGNSHFFSNQSGRYYVRCENSAGTCYSEFETLHFWGTESNAVPVPKPSSTSICLGESVNLMDQPACLSRMGYYDRWYTDSGLTTLLTNHTVTPTQTRTYYVQCVNSTGCPANTSRSVTITVNQNCPPPCNAPNPTITGDMEICTGASTSLTASGCTTGNTYLWSNNATTASITVNTAGTYTVKCVETGRPECESTTPGSATVTVNPLPTITAGTPVCALDGQTYSVTFTIPAGATIATTAGTVIGNVVSGINSGVTATITVTSAEGCTNTTTVMQNCAVPCNAPNPTISGDLSICEGETTTLTASDCTSGFAYSWSTGATTQSIVVNTEDTYTVKCLSNTNPYCESTTPGSATVTVNPLPTITAGTPVCAANGLTYSVTFTIPAGATIATTAGTVTGNVVSEINSGVTATITVTSAEGCTNTTTVMQNCTVPCNAPNPTVAGDMEICEGESTTLTASGCTTGYTYLWSNNATTASITVNASGTYTVKCVETGRPECESINPGSATVVVNPIPTITAGTPVCAADGQTYSVTFTIPAGATISTTAGTVTGNVVSEINSGVTATITVTSAEGCTNTTTVMQNCTVPCNAPTPTVAGDMEICQGESTTLTASGCTSGYTYLWSNNATTASITVNTAGTYTVKCVETGRPECESINPGSATVVVNPTPTITAGTPVCALDGQTYSVTFTIPAGATITTTAGTVTGNVVSEINSGVTATITVTSAEGCINTTTVMQNCTVPCNAPNPTVAGDMEICQGESTTLTASGCTTGYTYLWSNNATTASITVNAAGTYTVKCVETGRPECESTTPGSATVTVNPIPTITAGTPVCAADGLTYSVTFTIPAGATITTTAGTVSGNVVSEINSGVTATITVTSAEGCTNTTTVMQNCTVPCNAPNPTVAGDMEICEGESTTLTASGCTTGYTYLWSTNATTASITVNAAGTYTVKCVETGRPECESLNPGSATVVVNPIPTITAGTPVCAPDGQTYSVTFTIPAGATISTTAGTVSGNVVSGINSGVTATITVTSAEGCTNTTTVMQNCTVPCNAPTPTVAGDMEICEGESTTLTASGCTTGYTYLWSNNATTTSITVNTAGTYTVKCVETGRPECESINPGSATVTVNPIPTITAGTPVCTADGLTYSVTFTIPAGATITTTEGIVTGNVVSGINSGVTATITVTSAEGCTNSTTVTQNCTVPVFDLALRKVLPNGAKNPTVTAGSTVTFKIEVWNQGNVAAQNVVVTDYIPNGLTLVPDGNWTAGTGVATLTNPIPALAAGDSTSVNISFTVNSGFTGSIRNFAEISDADNTEGLEDIDSTPDSNPGNDGTPKDDNISEDHKNNPTQDEDDHDYEDITVSPAPVFDLALRKVLPNGAKNPTVTPGSTVTFKIEIWNQGTVAAQNVVVTDYIPNGLTLVADGNWTAGTGVATLTNPIAALSAGDSTSVNISFTVNTGFTGSIRNFAEISDVDNTEGLEDIDSTPDSNPGNDGTPVDDEIDEDHKNNPDEDEDDHDYEDITVSPAPVFDLALRKTMAPGSKTIYKVGDVVTFDITVFNQGTVAATSVDLVDYIPSGLTLQTGSGWTLDGEKARWTGAISNLVPGAQQTVQISFVVNASATGVIINTAEISGATNPQNLEDIDSTPDDDKDNDSPVKNDEINEDGKNNPNDDEDDHDIEPITICTDGKCITAKAVKNK